MIAWIEYSLQNSSSIFFFFFFFTRSLNVSQLGVLRLYPVIKSTFFFFLLYSMST